MPRRKRKYEETITIGFTDDGKRIRKYIGADSKPEFERLKKAAIIEANKVRSPSDVTLDEYADKWYEVYKANLTSQTKAEYKYAKDKLAPIKMMRLKDVTASDLQRIINQHSDHPRSCQQLKSTMCQIWKQAIKDGIIYPINIAEDLELPHYKAAEKRALTEAERKIIRTVKLPDRERAFLDVLYYFGLRRGEALALTRSDFDFKTLLLTVNKSIAFDGNDSVTKDTKTHVARYVPIPKQIQKRIKAYVASCGFRLFANADGTQMTRSGFRTMWERIADAVNKAAGGTDDLKVFKISPHMLRHDYATRLYYVPGISTKKKADILGHQEQLFLRLYSHLDDDKEDLDTFRKLMNF